MIGKSATVPLFIYGTRHSTLYNLTPTNMPKNISAIQLCYGDFHDYIQTLLNLPQNMTFKKFINFPENTLTYLSPYDFSKEDCMTGCQNNSKVKIKCNKGYTQVTAQMYDKLVSIIKPDMYVTLTQYPFLQKDHQNQSNKSYKRATNKTKAYLLQSENTRDQQNDNYKGGLRLAAVHGGKNLSLLNRSLQQVLDHAIDGIVVCDLCENQTIAQRQQVFQAINKRLQQQYQRQGSYFKKNNKKLQLVLAGYGKLEDIQHALKFGYKLFEVNYPFTLTQKHLALVWNEQKSIYSPKQPTKRQDLKPLSQQCKCYACLHHSEAYIAHLIDCHQLTGKVLLSIHNISVYQRWLQKKKLEIQQK